MSFIESTDYPTRNAAGKPRTESAWAIDLSRYAGKRRPEKACRAVGGLR